MEKFGTIQLIDELLCVLKEQIAHVDRLQRLDVAELSARPDPDRWSVLEIAEHMNLSSGHYHRLLQQVFSDPGSRIVLKEYFEPGRFGEMSVKAMRPTNEGKINWKMKTLGIFEPRTAITKGKSALDELGSMLQGFRALLEKARERGLEGPKITSTLGPILRFKIGDAFRFPIAHQQRHFLQIDRTLQQVKAQRTLERA